MKNKGTPPVQAVRETIMRGVERMTQRYSAQSEPKAYLIVQEGDTSVGKHLEIFGATTIGRDKQDAELLFQLNDANSPISRRHCTILDEEDHFQIRDEDSANGTYLNGVRLQPMIPRSLYDGDEIELARVERGGVKLQFQTVQPAAADQTMIGVKPNFDETHGTRVVKRPSPPDSGDSF
ncbi:MAG: FHA domain-containing protein [Chloroflexi bacterium]|nr:FHA domain-containing protein [Chloroflexota bacterium]